MTKYDAEKINNFCFQYDEDGFADLVNPIYIVAGIPDGNDIDDMDDYCQDLGYNGFPEMQGKGPYPFNFQTIDGDYFVAYPGINKDGEFELFGDDSNYTYDRDCEATEEAFRKARQARFEHGEKPNK